MLADVSGKLVDQFAACLSQEILSGTPEPVADAPTSGAASVAAPTPRVVKEAEPIDLLGTAGSPVLKRLAPLVAGLVALLLLIKRLRR